MNARIYLFLFTLCLGLLIQAEKLTLTLENGDMISGEEVTYSLQEQEVAFNASLIKAPLSLSPTVVEKITATDFRSEQSEARLYAEVIFTNGDKLQGLVDGADEETINFIAQWGERLILKKSMISEIQFFNNGEQIMNGFGSLSDWTSIQKMDGITLENESLRLEKRIGISRKVPFNRKTHYSLELDWQTRPQASFYFHGNFGGVHNPGAYIQLSIQQNRIEGRFSSEDSKEMFGQKNSLNKLLSQKNLKLDVYIDLVNLNFIVLVENQTVANWKLPEEAKALAGEWFYLFSNSSQPLEFKNLKVYEWDGVVTLEKEGVDDLLEEESSLVELQNGDLIVGEVISIEKEAITLKDKFDEQYRIEVGRIKELKLNGEIYEEPRRYAGDCRVLLGGDSNLTLRVLSIQENTITAFSQMCGEITLPLKECSSIEFNLYE